MSLVPASYSLYRQVSDFPLAGGIQYPRVGSIFLVLYIERQSSKDAPVTLYVTDFTTNKQSGTTFIPREEYQGNIHIPKDKILRVLVYPKLLPTLDNLYKSVNNDDLGICDWWTNASGLNRLFILEKILIVSSNLKLKLYIDSLECLSYDHQILNSESVTSSQFPFLEKLFTNMGRNFPREFFEFNPTARRIVPRLYWDNPRNEEGGTQILGYAQPLAGNANTQLTNTEVHVNETQPKQETESQYAAFIDDIEHPQDYASSPAPNSRVNTVVPRRPISRAYSVSDLLKLDDTEDNRTYQVNAIIAGTIPSDWSLICGKQVKTRRGKPAILDPVIRGLELVLVDSTWTPEQPILCGINTLSIYIDQEDVLDFFGVERIEKVYTSIADLDEKFEKCVHKPCTMHAYKTSKEIHPNGTKMTVWTAMNLTLAELIR
ncbi:uncharacterized protein J8A68_003884 [[Candida] subhashii]|uniref:Uncharacterized protein n=1 Tax=[Candida] subhashii TaxID=561895 RepID=A0A8J5QLI2_9ASCO|nr:uncharacterized protein J8A68_003884 [[Candida] subhashii]KAG7662587.1 hypothetical protein J8A68_003884 [[Candida] subhashii]